MTVRRRGRTVVGMKETVDVFISSPLLETFRDSMTTILETLKNLTQTDDVNTPTLRLFKFNELLVNIVLKHIINDNTTDFVSVLKESSPDDYKMFCEVADEIKSSINDLVFDIPFVCESITLFANGDMVNLKVRFTEDEL